MNGTQPTCFDKLSTNGFSLANETFKRPCRPSFDKAQDERALLYIDAIRS
jgi:hypothetical protein